MLTHGLRTLFLAQAAIASQVPAQIVNRVSLPCIFTDNAPQGVMPPYIVIHSGSTDPMLTLDAYSESLKSDDIDIQVVGYNLPNARAISETIRQYFDDYLGFFAAGNNAGTATQLTAANGTLAIVGQADGTKGVQLPTFTGTFQVANIQETHTLVVYLPNNSATTVAAATIATYTNNSGTYSQTGTTTANAPIDVVHAVLWQDENYAYDYPDEGRDTKYHQITTTWQVMSEQGV